MITLKPWDAVEDPTAEAVTDRLAREGLKSFVRTDPAGSRHGHHAHVAPEVLWMVSGRIRCGGPGLKDMEAGPGDRLAIPGGTVHWVVVTGDQPAVYCSTA